MTRPRIDVFRPTLSTEELQAVAATFESGWIGKGQRVAEFEAAWAAHIGVDPAHVVSVNSATEGLFQVCEYLELQPGDDVVIPSIHFIGAANAVLHTGADIEYCDVDPHTLNPTREHIVDAITDHTKAVILLHYGGVAQELDDIRQLCSANGICLIEDAACAQATTYQNKAVGTWGNFGIWSFDAMKVISCGDGGMIYCERPQDAKFLRTRTYLGMAEQSGLSNESARWWEFRVGYPRRRSIMNDIAASIGLEQLKKLPAFVERRKQIVWRYDDELDGIVDIPPQPDIVEGDEPYYFYWIQTPRRDELAKHLRSHNIYVTFRYYPLHWVFKTGQHLPGAEYAANNTLLLPLHQGLTDSDVEYICGKVKEFFT